MRIAAYAKMRIAAPGLRKKILRRTMQLKRRPDLRECAELLSSGDPVKGNQETHQEIGPGPSNLRGWKGQRENPRDVPDADWNTPANDFHLGKRTFERV
jgi:hypothetical protein